jgi:hypothetical protein
VRGDNAVLNVFVRFDCRPNADRKLLAELMLILEPTRAEAGCVGIHLYASLREPLTFVIHSTWVDEAGAPSAVYCVLMLTLFRDETDDGHSYALGGWLITPIHYDIFSAEWTKMLGTITMPDGSPCRAFHASLMMNQRRPFAGWTKEQAFDAFDKATSILADRPGRFSIRPCAVAAEIPEGVVGADKDAIRLILFMKFFALVIETFPAAQGITFVFDKKRDVEKAARIGYAKVAKVFASQARDVSGWHELRRR